MTEQATKTKPGSFEPIADEAEWEAQGWATESEPLTAVPRLEALISIRLDPESAALIRQAAQRLGISRVEFVRRAAIEQATGVLRQSEQ
jgi:hypothetical protein